MSHLLLTPELDLLYNHCPGYSYFLSEE